MVKKVLAGLLVLGVGIAWIPQLMSAKTDTKPVVAPEVPAEGPSHAAVGVADGLQAGGASGEPTNATSTESSAKSSGAKDATAPTVGAGTESAAVVHEDLAGSLDSALARAQSLLATPMGSDRLPSDPFLVDDAHEPTQASAQAPTPTPADFAPVSQSQATEPNLGGTGDSTPPADPIDVFLASHPLQGTVIGASDRVATLGPLLVRVGDEPVRGLVVTQIASGHVELRCTDARRGESTLRVDLEPFRARAPSSGSGSSGRGSGTGAAGGNVGGAPNAGAGGANAASATSGLEQLTARLQEANRALEDAAKAASGSTGDSGKSTTTGANATGTSTPKGTTSTSTGGNSANGNKEPHGS